VSGPPIGSARASGAAGPGAPAASWRRRAIALALLLAGAAALIAPAFLLSPFRLFQLTLAAGYAVAILGLNLVTGYNGQISLGHGAFYAAGAYATAILMTHFDWPFWATLPVAGLASGALGYAVGFPALRLGGLYLALTTFSLAVAVPQLLKHRVVEDWTGGVQGLFITKPDPPAFLPVEADQWLYLTTLAVAAALFLAARNLVRGRIGRAMRAIRDHPVAAEAAGMDLAAVKTRTFAASAALTGLAGALGAVAVEFVAPDSFTVMLSITLFVGMVVGGAASIGGAVVGGLFIVFVPNLAESISKAAPGAIYGVLLILLLFVLPGGAAGIGRLVAARLCRRDGGR
jgi:branched-chain amino acid transport system permease protein